MGVGDVIGPISGDGFVRIGDGTRRWGRYGAAGLLVRHVSPTDDLASYFVALRSDLTHMGGTWAIPGGALNREETPVDAARREFREEVGVHLPAASVTHIYEDDHGGWSYWTVVVDVEDQFPLPTNTNWETAGVRWVEEPKLGDLDLLAPFRATMVRLGYLRG